MAQNELPLRAVHGDADVVRGLGVLEGSGSAASCFASGEFGPNTLGMSTAVFSRSMLAVATSPVLQPARVKGAHGAGVIVSGAGGCAAVAGGTGAYTMDGLVSWPGLGGVAVL